MSTLSLLGISPITSLLIALASLPGKKTKSKTVGPNNVAKKRNNQVKTKMSSNKNKLNSPQDKTNETAPKEIWKDKSATTIFKDSLNNNHNKGYIDRANHTNNETNALNANDKDIDDDDDDEDDD